MYGNISFRKQFGRFLGALFASRAYDYVKNRHQARRGLPGPGRGGGSSGKIIIPQKKSLVKRKRKYKRRKNKKGKQELQSISQHNDASSQKLPEIVLKKRKLPFKYKFKWQQIKQVTVTGNVGEQLVFYGPTWNGTQYQFSGSVTGSRSQPDKWEVDPYALNPYVNTLTTSALYPGAFTFPLNNDKLFYHGYNQHYSIVNLTDLACDVQILWCLCKSHTNSTPITHWDDCAQNEERLTQTAPTVASLTTTTTVQGGYSYHGFYGTHPAEYKTWKKYWKILDSYQFTLQGGDQRDVHRFIRYNACVSKRYWSQMPTASVAGYTIIPIFICRAALVGVRADATPGTLASEVTYGACKIGVVENQEHRFGGVPIGNQLETSRVYQGIIDVGDATQPRVHIDDVDAIQAEQVA